MIGSKQRIDPDGRSNAARYAHDPLYFAARERER